MSEQPYCTVHGKPGEYVFGSLVVCPECRALPAKTIVGTPVATPIKPDFTDDEITEESGPWYEYLGGKWRTP